MLKFLFLLFSLHYLCMGAVQLEQHHLQKLIEISQSSKIELSNSKIEIKTLRKKLTDSQVKINSMQSIINKQLQELEQTSIQLSNQQITWTNESTDYLKTIMSLKESYGNLQTKIVQMETQISIQIKAIISLSSIILLFIILYGIKIYITKKLW